MAEELRGQFIGLGNQVADTFDNSAANADGVAALGLTVSNPHTKESWLSLQQMRSWIQAGSGVEYGA